MYDLAKIAHDAASLKEALETLHARGATPIQAIKALLDGRGLSLRDAKAALNASPAWSAEAKAAAELHGNLFKALDDENL